MHATDKLTAIKTRLPCSSSSVSTVIGEEGLISHELHNPSELVPVTIRSEALVHGWTLTRVGVQQGRLVNRVPLAAVHLVVLLIVVSGQLHLSLLAVGVARGGAAPVVVAVVALEAAGYAAGVSWDLLAG